MARINAYPFITTIADSDSWIGTKASDGSTKQFTAADVAAYVNSTPIALTVNYASEAAAIAGGVPLYGLYRNGDNVKVRITP